MRAAQTLALATRSPGASFLSVDISLTSLAETQRVIDTAGLTNVELRQADLLDPPFAPESFDHIFVCFVLEHLADPVRALVSLRRLLRPAGTITVIEGDHGSAGFHPDNPSARAVIHCQVELQRRTGGNALIGRQLFPLLAGQALAAVLGLASTGLRRLRADRSSCDTFTRKTFTAMVGAVRDDAIAAGLIDAASFDAGINALHRTTDSDGVSRIRSSRPSHERRFDQPIGRAELPFLGDDPCGFWRTRWGQQRRCARRRGVLNCSAFREQM